MADPVSPEDKALVVPSVVRIAQKRQLNLAAIAATLFAVCSWLFLNYLQTRGSFGMSVPRIFLGLTWVTGIAAIVLFVIAHRTRGRAYWISGIGIAFTLILGSLEYSALRQRPDSIPTPAEDPIVHIEPEKDILWSTHPGQQLGIFTVYVHNTGIPIDVTEINLKFFLAQHSSGIIIKRLPNLTDPHRGPLQHDASFPLSLDFNPYVDEIAEISGNFKEGPSLAGVYVVVTYRRHSDGKDFSLSKPFGLMWVPYGDTKKPKGVALYTEGTNMDDIAPAPLQNSRLTLSEIAPFLPLSERWISITKYIGVGPDGKVISSLERPLSTISRHAIPAHIPSRVESGIGSVGSGRADLKLEFVGKDQLRFMYFADSSESANQPKRFFGLWDITRPFFYQRLPNIVQALPLAFKTEADFVFHGHRQGPMDVLDSSEAIAHVKPGDRLFGMADVLCFNCEKERSYWVYFEVGSGGWYAEMDTPPWGTTIAVPKPESTKEQQDAALDEQVPRGKRIVIPER